MPSEAEKRLSDGIFACNSNAAGQNQGASDTVIGHPNRVNLGLTQERRCDFTSRTVSTASHNVRRNISKGFFLIGQQTNLPHRRTDIKIAALQTFARRNEAARADHHVIFNNGIVQNGAAHTDQDAVTDSAAVQHHFVPHGNVFADNQRRPFGFGGGFVGNAGRCRPVYCCARRR